MSLESAYLEYDDLLELCESLYYINDANDLHATLHDYLSIINKGNFLINIFNDYEIYRLGELTKFYHLNGLTEKEYL